MELLIEQFMNQTGIDSNYDPKGQRESGYYSEQFKDKYIEWLEEKLKSSNSDYAKCPNCGSKAKGFKTPVMYHCSNEDCQWSGHFA